MSADQIHAEKMAEFRRLASARSVSYDGALQRVTEEALAYADDLAVQLEAERERLGRCAAELGAICAGATVRPGEEFLAVYGAATVAVQSLLAERDALYWQLEDERERLRRARLARF
jgi:hypothetical protein